VLTFFTRVRRDGPERPSGRRPPQLRRAHAARARPADREDIALRLRHPTDPLAYLHQVAVAASHNTYGRLGDITAPTPCAPAATTACSRRRTRACSPEATRTRKPDAVAGCGHVYTTAEPDADREVARFLERDVSSARATHRRRSLTPRRKPETDVRTEVGDGACRAGRRRRTCRRRRGRHDPAPTPTPTPTATPTPTPTPPPPSTASATATRVYVITVTTTTVMHRSPGSPRRSRRQ